MCMQAISQGWKHGKADRLLLLLFKTHNRLILNNMTETIIYGSSDDLIEIEGGGHYEEFGAYDPKAGDEITCSDGTILQPVYNGTWDFELIHKGPAFSKIVPAVGEKCEHEDYPNATSYSSVVVFDVALDWIKFHGQTSERNPNRIN